MLNANLLIFSGIYLFLKLCVSRWRFGGKKLENIFTKTIVLSLLCVFEPNKVLHIKEDIWCDLVICFTCDKWWPVRGIGQ